MKYAFDRISRGLQNYLGKKGVKSPEDHHKGKAKTALVDVQRRIGIYLHALWGRDFTIRAIDEDFIHHGKYHPFVENNVIHLPNFYYDFSGDSHVSGLEVYRAAAIHAAAHIVYTPKPFAEKSFDRWQKTVISVIEDARVETLLVRNFPGLKQLFCKQHTVNPASNRSAGDYLNRLARALLDEGYQDEDSWIKQGRLLFKAEDDLGTSDISLEIGVKLAREFLSRKIKFNVHADSLKVSYRDDNRYLWTQVKPDDNKAQELPTSFFELKLMMGNNEFANTDEDNKEVMELTLPNRVSASSTFVYPEWDYKVNAETPAWVTVREKTVKPGDLELVDRIVAQNRDLVSRMKRILHAIRFTGVRRIRKLEEGDEIDINAAIRAQIDIRMRLPPDTRVMMRQVRKSRDIPVLLLLDLSNSTNQKIRGHEHTVLQLTQQICVLFAEVIEDVGDPFAIHGFCSKSRHDVDYFRFKDFDQAYDEIPKARIAGMIGQRSTRMGAAIRHAAHLLNEQESDKKLLMIITDGAPSDIDVRGTNYLTYDAKMAVQDAGRRGIHTHCISLDFNADQYVSRIFGARNYMVVDHIKGLPEKMLMIYAGLTV